MLLRQLKKIIKYSLPYGIVHHIEKRRGWYFKKPVPRFRQLERRHDECIVVVNGPSAKPQLGEIGEYAARADILTVNFSLLYDEYRALRPLAHFWVDPLFFISRAQHTGTEDFDVCKKRMHDTCAAIDWPITLYVPAHYYESAIQWGYATEHISLAAVPTLAAPRNMPIKRRFRLMDMGVYSAGAQTVSTVAIYMAIAARYKKIWIAGFDADFFNSLRVDETCRVIMKTHHGYGKEVDADTVVLTMNLARAQNICASLSTELYEAKKYADYCGVELVNISRCSCLDFAPKGILGGPRYPFFKYGNQSVKLDNGKAARKP